jgi:CubicO group peptidase (beta-lactamase class C family)
VAECWWEPYKPELQHIMFSVSKSFTATAVGLAADEGKLSVDEPVLDVFPSYASLRVRDNVRGMRVRDLLTMSTGHATDTMVLMRDLPEYDWVGIFLSSPVEFPPGSHFLYNSGASYVLSAMVQARTGLTVAQYLRPRLFDPRGFEDPQWVSSRRGINLGASGLRIRTRELARFGQLYLQEGVWADQQVLRPEWVREATARQVSNGEMSTGDDWQQGYGYQFWRCRNDAYRADGAFGQFCVVLPGKEVVLAITSGSEKNRQVMELFWRCLDPGIPSGQAKLATSLKTQSRAAWLTTRSVPLGASQRNNPAAERRLGDRDFELPPNLLRLSRFRVVFEEETCTFIGWDEHDERHLVCCGRDGWVLGESSLWEGEEPEAPVRLAGRAGWDNAGQFIMTWQYVETPFCRVIKITEESGGVCVSVDLDLPFWTERKIAARAGLG